MTDWYWPNGSKSIPYVTSEWNPRRRHPVLGVITPHNGIDTIGYDYNRAIGAGVVTAARYEFGAGWTVRILHDDGSESAQKHHKPGLRVRVGQRVKPRQIIGLQGASGLVTGKHNHLETRYYPGGPSVDPREFLGARLSWAGTGTPIQLDEEYPIMKPEIFHSKTRHVAVAPWLVDGHYLIPGRLVVAAERTWEKGSGSSDAVKTEGELDDIIELAKIAGKQYQATQRVASGGSVDGSVLDAIAGIPAATVLELGGRLRE